MTSAPESLPEPERPRIESDDPFRFEAMWGEFDPKPIDRIECEIGQVDWIGGFGDNGCKTLEMFITPMLRCIGRTPYTNASCCESIARTSATLRRRTIAFRAASTIAPDMVMPMRAKRATLRIPEYTSVIDRRAHPSAVVSDMQVDDAKSTALPFSDLEKLRPEIAGVIATRGHCPPSVSYYVQDNADATYAIPTASILQACYAPSALASHLADPRRHSSFASDRNVFDGYSYGEPGLCYPMRSMRFIDRAEHEVAQILPRAAAYYRKHRTFLPLLLRPPFTGKVTIAGSAITDERGRRRVVVFTSSVCFYSKSAEALRYARYSRHKPHFAPQLYRVITLTDAGRGVSHHGLQYSYDEFCDTHLFGSISRAVLDSLRRGELREAPNVTYDVGEMMRYRNWVAERLLR